MDICSYPQLFAAYHVLLRLLVPRHSPDAVFTWPLFIFVLRLICPVNCLFFISSFLEILDLTFLSFCSFHGSFLNSACASLRSFLVSLVRLRFSFSKSLVEMRRIELLTSCLQGRRSPSWATPPSKLGLYHFSNLLIYEGVLRAHSDNFPNLWFGWNYAKWVHPRWFAFQISLFCFP